VKNFLRQLKAQTVTYRTSIEYKLEIDCRIAL